MKIFTSFLSVIGICISDPPFDGICRLAGKNSGIAYATPEWVGLRNLFSCAFVGGSGLLGLRSDYAVEFSPVFKSCTCEVDHAERSDDNAGKVVVNDHRLLKEHEGSNGHIGKELLLCLDQNGVTVIIVALCISAVTAGLYTTSATASREVNLPISTAAAPLLGYIPTGVVFMMMLLSRQLSILS